MIAVCGWVVERAPLAVLIQADAAPAVGQQDERKGHRCSRPLRDGEIKYNVEMGTQKLVKRQLCCRNNKAGAQCFDARDRRDEFTKVCDTGASGTIVQIERL